MLQFILLTLLFSATQTLAQSTVNDISTELKLKREDAVSLKPKLRPDDLNTSFPTEDKEIDELPLDLTDLLSAEKSTNSFSYIPNTQQFGNCWVVDVGDESSQVIVTIKVELTREGKISSAELISAKGGSDAAKRKAFQAARRAIIRCQGRGYDLPRDKYDFWKTIEMTFDPTHMRKK